MPLGYGLTPHITVAYFRPGVMASQQLSQLRKAFRPVDWEVRLEMDKLVYQKFTDMNHYSDG